MAVLCYNKEKLMPHTLSSPWLAQLRSERPHFHLEKNIACDVAVIGAGIAGISTAYHILKNTNLNVVLIDAGRIAHGATGRNAGQVVNAFERPLTDIAAQYGLEMTSHAQSALDSAWDIIGDILHNCALRTPLHPCPGYRGYTTLSQILENLDENVLRLKTGLPVEPVLFKANDALLQEIPEHLRATLVHVPHSLLLKSLQTEDTSFIAASVARRGCMNSALFCEELVAWMTTAFGSRLTVAEHLPVQTIEAFANNAVLRTSGPTITAGRVVLCTNGFENFSIQNRAGETIDPLFHHVVRGYIGYMTAYLEDSGSPPTAIAYVRERTSIEEPYAYLTRRPYEKATGEPSTLVCLGGPERVLPDRAQYDATAPFPADVEEELDRTLRQMYYTEGPSPIKAFAWQGLMGYTPDFIRRIGPEPRNPVLLYNLGCNGIGILPSLYGGKRIAQILAGHHLPPSLFDPRETYEPSNQAFQKEVA
jgi:glycine/D-amino acid oxidase-like deaminating enzyme